MKNNTFIELKARVVGNSGNQKIEFNIDWSPVGRLKMKSFIIALCTGKYLDNLLNAIEDNNTEEAMQIVKEVEEYYSGALNTILDQFKPEQPQQNNDEDILPSDAFGGGQI